MRCILIALTLAITCPVFAADPKQPMLLCIPEKFWTCDGTGECYMDRSPETLAAWKIDLVGSRYALCKRNGAECAAWRPLRVDGDKPELFYTMYDGGSWHPETFKIDTGSGKFVAVRLSGGFVDVDISKSPFTERPNFANLLIRQRVGTCVAFAR
ncbi:MAG: hypothetical protein M3O61_16275 [Gemmatimonadota bacterium]|nr:hypothetical protein [Gemmatimonadota bacterium]